MALFDIIIDNPFKEGDFNISESDNQNKQTIILTEKGQVYQFPTLGVGIKSFLNAPTGNQFLQNEINAEFAKDNYLLTDYVVDFNSGNVIITLDAERIET